MNEVILANPRGFCAGVDRAIAIVEQALARFGAPIYVRHEVVHNKFVVDDLKAKGAIFVDELADVPQGNTVVFSAHGVSRAVRDEAAARGLTVFDATCPLVTKVHVEVAKMHANGREIVMIGHAGHPEVEGTMGQADGGIHLVESVADVDRLVVRDPSQLAYVTQTTLSVDDAATIVSALKRRFPAIVGPRKDDICYATQNRQDAVKFLAPQCDVVIVVGSPNSSNSNRLREVAAHRGIPAYMIDRAEELQPEWVEGKRHVGVTAGASAPEILVQQVHRTVASARRGQGARARRRGRIGDVPATARLDLARRARFALTRRQARGRGARRWARNQPSPAASAANASAAATAAHKACRPLSLNARTTPSATYQGSTSSVHCRARTRPCATPGVNASNGNAFSASHDPPGFSGASHSSQSNSSSASARTDAAAARRQRTLPSGDGNILE